MSEYPIDKQSMIHVNIRLPKDVLDYYKRKYPLYTRGMREVLEAEHKKDLRKQEVKELT